MARGPQVGQRALGRLGVGPEQQPAGGLRGGEQQHRELVARPARGRLPGFVEVGDAAGLARALEQVATDEGLRAELTRQVQARRHLFTPDCERQAWADLLTWLRDSSAGQPA